MNISPSSMNALQKGSIKLFIGPMFASKSSSLCAEVDKYRLANKSCIIVKFTDDQRYVGYGITSHAGFHYDKIPVVSTTELAAVYDEIAEYEVIGVDEVQFYPDNVEIMQRLANSGHVVVAAGLDANYRGQPFQRIGELVAIAEDVIKLKAVCMSCCNDASFTHRTTECMSEIDIGGGDKYVAVCRRCMQWR